MFDDDDIGDFALIFLPTSWPGFVLWIVILGVLAVVVAQNHDECAQLSCDSGQQAELLDNRCLCVEEAQ